MGLLDRILSIHMSRKHNYKDNPNSRKHLLDEHHEDTALIIMGWNGDIRKYKSLLKRFEGMKKIVYQPPTTLISPDISDAKKAFIKTTKELDIIFKKNKIKTVYGLSLGCVFAVYAVNRNNVEKMILAMPVDEIIPVMWHSPRTKGIIKEAKKLYTKEDYLKALSGFDPINNISNLGNTDIRIFIAHGDSIIPYKNGMNLVKALRKQGYSPKVKVIPLAGHYIACVISGFASRLFRAMYE